MLHYNIMVTVQYNQDVCSTMETLQDNWTTVQKASYREKDSMLISNVSSCIDGIKDHFRCNIFELRVWGVILLCIG